MSNQSALWRCPSDLIEKKRRDMRIVEQPFFIFYASRLKEVVQIRIASAPDGIPSLGVLHHDSKVATIASTSSARFKERTIQIIWQNGRTGEEQSLNFTLGLCAYGNEALRLSFCWPDEQVRPISLVTYHCYHHILNILYLYPLFGTQKFNFSALTFYFPVCNHQTDYDY